MDIFEQLYKNNYVSKKKKKVYYPIKTEEDKDKIELDSYQSILLNIIKKYQNNKKQLSN